MNKNTIRRICDSVEPDWVDVKVVPKEEDRGRVKDIMEELGYTVEEEGDAIVVHTQYPEDTELLDDVIIENKQAIEMTMIYRDIINGTRELVSSVINNRLNNVMKYLTSITLVMAIPTIISGLYGMNVSGKWMPLSDTPYGFGIICIGTLVICILILLILRKKNML